MLITTTHNGKKTIYQVCNSIQDTGERVPQSIACFDDLYTAAVVMRYLQGCNLTDVEQIHATEALKKAAATTNHSADSRQKG